MFGPDGHGKGTFIGAIVNRMDEFAMSATTDVFLQAAGERHSAELAMLRGARLATAAETTKGRAWDERERP